MLPSRPSTWLSGSVQRRLSQAICRSDKTSICVLYGYLVYRCVNYFYQWAVIRQTTICFHRDVGGLRKAQRLSLLHPVCPTTMGSAQSLWSHRWYV